ncbi:MAG: potassium transporter TrkH [Proteobacteria bacterium]|nr:potassium transporter TrkH [Pseudomonadota bacterium]MBU1648847.1 potassium transporter TrkH [Pseudomonadota bacterium]MBU1986000.1 potassium transporter TrkH [Pseudomonadota bacterium]
MELKCLSRASVQRVGAEGLLMVLSSVPFMLAAMIGDTATPPLWRMAAAGVASISCLAAAFLLLRRPQLGRLFGGLALAGSTIVLIPFFESNPITVLLGAVMIIGAGYALADFRPCMDELQRSSPVDRCLQRARWAAMTMSGLVLAVAIVDRGSHFLVNTALMVSVGVTMILVMHWIWRRFAPVAAVALIMVSLVAICAVIFSFMNGYFRLTAFIVGILAILVLPDSTEEQDDRWWKILLSHPARVLLSTFFALCSLGTLLLLVPGATQVKGISLVDAAFTSVSAVCVTGLTVLDTPHDFTLFGQGLILLLIQLGGLGIMSIATVGMHALGRRMSLRQERLMTSMTDTDHQNLVVSLVTILRFTFVAEGLGALALTGLFHVSGDNWGQAAWRGLFTSISAFCNAGFALQSNNLIPYQGNPFILHVVALLIVFGGLAPATSLLVPRWLAGRPVAVGVRLVLVTTAVLLISGALFFLAFEWHGALSGMTVADKIHNAWFQSVTLRTAGFNSVDIAGVMNPSCLIMTCLMFIGGSPGGTAGGVKTTTIALLVMTFWASVTGRSEVIVQNRRIPPATINRAITIVSSGALLWLVMVLMLEMTQQIPARELLFEVTSALGTVGLSLGATNHLDGIGKIILMIAMFAGRIGPMTLFMLLSEERSVSVTRCLDAKVSLT